MSGLTCNENFHLGMQRYLHKFMRKEHLYWQALPCLKPWLYTSVSAAGQTSRAVTVPVSSSGLHQAQPPGRGSHRALQPRSSPSLLSRAACHTWWTPQLGECTIQNHCASTRSHAGSSELVLDQGRWALAVTGCLPAPAACACHCHGPGNRCPLSLQLPNAFFH